MARNALAWVQRLSLRSKLAGGVAMVAVVAIGAYFAFGLGRGCYSRDDVTARVAIVSSGLQQAAAQGKLKIEALAVGIKRMNEAASAYNANNDQAAFCNALDQIAEAYKLNE